jgi:hypothetical protein
MKKEDLLAKCWIITDLAEDPRAWAFSGSLQLAAASVVGQVREPRLILYPQKTYGI